MRLPQDLANLLAVGIRDVIWFKPNVRAFLQECGVPSAIMVEVRKRESRPTLKTVHFVLDELESRGEEGADAARAMLTKMFYWKDLHTVEPDRKARAQASLQALQAAYRRYQEQQEIQKRQERTMQEDRVSRQTLQPLDHGKLQAFRDEFDATHAIADRQERGNRFQDLMNRIFDYYCEQSKGPFRRTGEQIDGLFYFDKHWYFVEVRWKEARATAADVSVLRDRAKDAFGGDTKALFISFNGFTEECLESLQGRSEERVVMMDGYDLRCVLDCQVAFDVLLAEKQGEVVKSKRPFIGAAEIINRRGSSAAVGGGER
jgi:hypothetical protein